MGLLTTILLTILGIFLLVLVISQMIIRVKPKPKTKDPKFERTIRRLNKIKDDKLFVKELVYSLEKKYPRVSYLYYIFHLSELSDLDIGSIIKKEKIPCHFATSIIKYALLKSRRFKEKDIKEVHTTIWFIFAHTYLKVKIKNKWYKIDLGAIKRGYKFGEKIPFFSLRW